MLDKDPAYYFKKLNPIGFEAMDEATTFCQRRGNPELDLVHWLHVMREKPNTDVKKILEHFVADGPDLEKDLTAALDALPRGASRIYGYSPQLAEMAEQGWLTCSLIFEEQQVRTGFFIVGILKSATLRTFLFGISPEFKKLNVEVLEGKFHEIVSGSVEDVIKDPASASGAGGGSAAATGAEGSALEQYSVDLTEKARNGEIDPIFCRENEIRQIIDILMRRRQNNPILTGEAGVGKTAVVEGFAQRIADGDVPPKLRDVSLRSLDLGLLQAGASMKGEFEKRLRAVIDEVQDSPKPIVLFIDEAHTLIGAGGAEGQGDAANLLKPALARGTLRTVAATTWAEYKKFFEKDAALTRRFQVVKVEEPDEAQATIMLRGLVSVLEDHHSVRITTEALDTAVKLSRRYIPARQLPDKAISLLDTSCARVAVSQHATPPSVEDCQHRIATLEIEREVLERESTTGTDNADAIDEVSTEIENAKNELVDLEEAWKKEKAIAEEIFEKRLRLLASNPPSAEEPAADSAEEPAADPTEESPADGEAVEPAAATTLGEEERQAIRDELRALENSLSEMQGESPLVLPDVDESAVSGVVADWTGIPVGKMVKDEMESVLHLPDLLGKRIIGQRHGLDAISKRVLTARAGIDNPQKPVGVFMLAGPSGVGKTETALALAEALYGGEENLITINMSEFQEQHTVSTLKGAPPGYVGYGEGGVLTEAVRRRPHSVVLLDEIEKAHPDVHEVFFQVFDKGWMEDGEGRHIDFKNTIILLTTNVGTELITNMCQDEDLMPEIEPLTNALREPLLKEFPPALLGRMVVIPYHPLSDDMLGAIIKLQLGRIAKRLKQNKEIDFTYTDEVVEVILKRCTQLESGGRMVDAILTHTLLPDMSREILTRMMNEEPVTKVEVAVNSEDDDFSYKFE